MFIVSSILILIGLTISLPIDPTRMDMSDTVLVVRFFTGYAMFVAGALIAFYGSWNKKA